MKAKDYIKRTEWELKCHNFALEKFSDLEIKDNSDEGNGAFYYVSDIVWKNYNHYEIYNCYDLRVAFWCEIPYFDMDEKPTSIFVGASDPGQIYLGRTYCDSFGLEKKFILENYLKVLDSHKANPELYDICRLAVLKFIEENPGYKVNLNELEPRLRNLIVFI
jgi:hypothetical protein